MKSSIKILFITPLFGVLMGGPIAYANKVPLGVAGNFVILSQSGITDVPPSLITGNVGTSPITGAADHLTCAEVVGHILSVDAAGPVPCSIPDAPVLTPAVKDMQKLYTIIAGLVPNITGLDAGSIGGRTLSGGGAFRWNTNVTILQNLTLSGSSTDFWIFQITGNLDIASAKSVILQGGALPEHIFWQVAGNVTIEPAAHMEGIILCKTGIAMQTGASINGRLYAQTAVTLQQNVVTQP